MLEPLTLEDELAANPGYRVFCLLKVGWRNHLEDLARGILRFRPLSFYRDLESRGSAHYDANEGIAAVLQSERTKILVSAGALSAEISQETGLLDQVLVSEQRQRMVLCMHAIHGGKWSQRTFGDDDLNDVRNDLQIPADLSRYGDHAWLITDREAFRTRLRAAVERRNVALNARLVRYVDFERVHGRVPKALRGFVKNAKDHSRDREYRIIIDEPAPLEDPFILDVGDLSDVSMVLPFEELRKSLSFRFDEPAHDQ